MADRVVRTTREGWGSRLGGAFKGIVVGLVLAALGVVLLFWGEGRAVRRAQALREGEKAAVAVSSARVDPTFEGRLVHLAGPATSDELLRDPELGQTSNGLRLARKVEMYQWREHQERKTEKKLGGSEETVTVYTYDRGWDDEEIDSSRFEEPRGHENPSFPIRGEVWTADPIHLGAFVLGDAFTGQLAFTRSPELSGFPPEVAGRPVTAANGRLFLGVDPAAPELGDVRVSFEEVPQGDVSVVGAQGGDRLQPYTTSNGQTIALLAPGLVPVEAMFQRAKAANTTLTWLLRGGGFLLLLIGFGVVLRPLRVVADVVPLAGRLAGAGIGFVAFSAAAVVSFVTIAIGWIFYRPLLGLTLLLVALLFGLWLAKRLRRAAVPPPPPPPPPAVLPPLPRA